MKENKCTKEVIIRYMCDYTITIEEKDCLYYELCEDGYCLYRRYGRCLNQQAIEQAEEKEKEHRMGGWNSKGDIE